MSHKKAWNSPPPAASPTKPKTHTAPITIIPVLWYLRQSSFCLFLLRGTLPETSPLHDCFADRLPLTGNGNG